MKLADRVTLHIQVRGLSMIYIVKPAFTNDRKNELIVARESGVGENSAKIFAAEEEAMRRAASV